MSACTAHNNNICSNLGNEIEDSPYHYVPYRDNIIIRHSVVFQTCPIVVELV